MDVNVQTKLERPILKRTDYTVRVAYEGATPKREVLREKIAHAIKSPQEHVVVRKIVTEFGKQAVIVDASVYPDAAHLEKMEPRHMKIRHAMPVPEKPKKKAKKK